MSIFDLMSSFLRVTPAPAGAAVLAWAPPMRMAPVASAKTQTVSRRRPRQQSCASMRAPLAIFVTLFLVAVAICSTLDAHSNVVPVEPQVAHAENVVGPTDLNLHASCGADSAHRHGRPNFQSLQDCDSHSSIVPASARL